MSDKMDFSEIAKRLTEDPSEENWKKFAAALKKSSAKFYRVVYMHGSLKNAEDLRQSYAELYDSKKKLIARVPIFKNMKNGVEGATIYLKGLENLPVV